MTADPAVFRFVSTNRRVREDRRFVAGRGYYVADVALEGMLHVAILPSQHPAARIVSIDASAALAMPGVHYVLTGDELAAATEPLDERTRYAQGAAASARGRARRVMPANGWSRSSPTAARWRKTPPKKSAWSMSRCRFVINAEQALLPDSPPVHPAHGSNVLLDRTFVWGEVDKHFAESPRHLVVPRHLGPQLDGSDRDVRRRGVLGSLARHAGCLGLDPDAEISRSDRARVADSGQLRPRASGRRCRRQLWRQARHQADRAGGASGAAARPSGALDRRPAGKHARRRRARTGAHFRRRGRLQQ